jgi:coupling of ubiquitin conjugation to ER degradation protein 1
MCVALEVVGVGKYVLQKNALTRIQAPPSFQPPPHFFPASSSSTTPVQPTTSHPDLITRYNLQGRIGSSDKGKQKDGATPSGASGWSSSKDERAKMMKERREEMILKARRKMLEKDAEETPSLQ